MTKKFCFSACAYPSKLKDIGARGAFRKKLESGCQKWISENSTKEEPLGRQGVESGPGIRPIKIFFNMKNGKKSFFSLYPTHSKIKNKKMYSASRFPIKKQLTLHYSFYNNSFQQFYYIKKVSVIYTKMNKIATPKNQALPKLITSNLFYFSASNNETF